MDKPKSSPTEKQGFLKRVFYHPNLNVAFGIIGVIGTVFGICAYYAAVKEPNLTYYISPNRTPIVQKGEINELAVKFGQEAITGDLSAVHVQIWNQGGAPIRNEDVLKNITITAENHIPIYQVRMKTTRSVSELHYRPPSVGRPDTVELDWKILEKGDAADLQIIYGGNINTHFAVDGVIVGQLKLTVSKDTSKENEITLPSFVIGLLMLFAIQQVLQFADRLMERWNNSWVKALVIVLLVTILIIFTSFLIFTINSLIFPAKPPFGF